MFIIRKGQVVCDLGNMNADTHGPAATPPASARGAKLTRQSSGSVDTSLELHTVVLHEGPWQNMDTQDKYTHFQSINVIMYRNPQASGLASVLCCLLTHELPMSLHPGTVHVTSLHAKFLSSSWANTNRYCLCCSCQRWLW